MAEQTPLWQEWKVVAELSADAFYHAWSWFGSNGKVDPKFVGDDFINCLVAYKRPANKARYYRLYRNEFYRDPRTGLPLPAELTFITPDKDEVPKILAEILGEYSPISIDISPHVKEPTPRLTETQKRVLDLFIPNRVRPIFHTKGGGWITLNRPLLNVWAVKHFERKAIRCGSLTGDAIGSGPHPGGYWDEGKGRWKGGLPVKVCNVDIDCAKNDAHVARASKLQRYLQHLGVESLLITSSDVLKSGASTPGLRLIFPIVPMWYSEFRSIMTNILEHAGLSLQKGKCELFPDSARGSRLPFGPGSDVHWDIGAWGGHDLQRLTSTSQEAIDMFLALDPVDLHGLSRKIGIVVDKYGRSPWLEPIEQRGAIAGPLTQRMLGAPSKDDGLSVKALLAYGLPAPNTRYAAVGALVGGFRKMGYVKEQVKQKVLMWLLTRHNGHSTLVNEGGEQEVRRWIGYAVDSLWRKPFRAAPSKSKVLGAELQRRALETSEKEFLRQNVEDSDLRSFLHKLWAGVKDLLHAAPGRVWHVSSELLSRCSGKKRYTHFLEEAQSLGLLERVSDSYTVSGGGRQGVCKRYRFHFQARLSQWAADCVEQARKFSKGGMSLLPQRAVHKNNNCPVWGSREALEGYPFFTASRDSGAFVEEVEDVVAGIEDWAMSRMMFGFGADEENRPDDITKKPTPTHENEEEKARETNIWSGAREFGDFLLRKGVEIHSTPYQEPENEELEDVDAELAAWSKRMLSKSSIQENSSRFEDEESGIYLTFGPKKRKKTRKQDDNVNLSFDFMK